MAIIVFQFFLPKINRFHTFCDSKLISNSSGNIGEERQSAQGHWSPMSEENVKMALQQILDVMIHFFFLLLLNES